MIIMILFLCGKSITNCCAKKKKQCWPSGLNCSGLSSLSIISGPSGHTVWHGQHLCSRCGRSKPHTLVVQSLCNRRKHLHMKQQTQNTWVYERRSKSEGYINKNLIARISKVQILLESANISQRWTTLMPNFPIKSINQFQAYVQWEKSPGLEKGPVPILLWPPCCWGRRNFQFQTFGESRNSTEPWSNKSSRNKPKFTLWWTNIAMENGHL